MLKLTPGDDLTVAEGENLQVGVEVGKTSVALASPPLIAWREKADFIQPSQTGDEHSLMEPLAQSGHQNPSPGRFVHVFADIQTPFAAVPEAFRDLQAAVTQGRSDPDS